MTIKEKFEELKNTPSDISEHLTVLSDYASKCTDITEMGVRTGVSTIAFLNGMGTNATLISYDIQKLPEVDTIEEMADKEGKHFVFFEKDVLDVEILPTDLLLIDTLHTFEQLSKELKLHSKNVKKYIILHDTKTFWEKGEIPGSEGLRFAVLDFVTNGDGRSIKEFFENNNGLTVLERC